MLQTYWLALALFATLMTLLYSVFAPRERVYLTSGIAAFAWAICAITAPAVTALNDAGDPVAAAVPFELQLFTAGLAAYSLLVLVLFFWGLYPPEGPAKDYQPMQD